MLNTRIALTLFMKGSVEMAACRSPTLNLRQRDAAAHGRGRGRSSGGQGRARRGQGASGGSGPGRGSEPASCPSEHTQEAGSSCLLPRRRRATHLQARAGSLKRKRNSSSPLSMDHSRAEESPAADSSILESSAGRAVALRAVVLKA